MGEIPERSKGTDCKSVGNAFVGSNPTLATSLRLRGNDYEEMLGFVWLTPIKAKM